MAGSSTTLERIKSELIVANAYISFLPSSSEGAAGVNASGPSLILLLGWRGGKMIHLLKYAAGVRDLYPDAAIIIFRTPTKYYFMSTGSRETILTPAVNYLHETVRSAGSNYRGTLVYVLSSGGGFHLMALRKLLRSYPSKFSTPPPPGPTALILDSSPGASGLDEAVTSAAPRNFFLKLLWLPPIVLVYSVMYAVQAFNGDYPISYELRTTLNAIPLDEQLPTQLKPPLLPTVTPDNSKETPRLYIYSRTDRVTPYPKLEEHVAEAVNKGFDVRVELFKKSAHVAHVREDPDKYWAAVKGIWDYVTDGRRAARLRAVL